MDYLCSLFPNQNSTLENVSPQINNNNEPQKQTSLEKYKNEKIFFDSITGGFKLNDCYDDDMYDSRRKALESKQYSYLQVEHHFSGHPASGKTTVVITRNGEYCETPILKLKMNASAIELKPCDLLRQIALEIGGIKIDQFYGSNLDVLLETI